jgi:flavorubredoxin
LIRRVASDLYVVGECVEGVRGHEAVRVYVLKNGKSPILIDTGSHLHRKTIMDGLDEVLDGTPPESIFLTHTELPHAGNVRAISQKWPKAVSVVSSTIIPYIELAPVVDLERIALAPIADVASYGGRSFEFVNAPLKDQPASQWIYDFKTKTLFTADAFGYYHAPGECDLFEGEGGSEIRFDDLREYHRVAFRYLRWVIPGPLNEALDEVFVRDVKIIAPVHGNPITNDIGGHVRMLQEVDRQICEGTEKTAPRVRTSRGARKDRR